MDHLYAILPLKVEKNMTISKELLKIVVLDQHKTESLPEVYIQRSNQKYIKDLNSNREIIVLTGIRRCGKSVLQQYARSKIQQKDYYLNFEDERLVSFELQDFQTLQEIFISLYGEQNHYYFDEIQNIPGWEMFVRRLYNNGNKIYITGSNANLFSEELGTRLTGRYIKVNIYPLSFLEFANYKEPDISKQLDVLSTSMIGRINQLFDEYLQVGSIPEYIKNKNKDYLHSLYESILFRDIVTRYRITDVDTIKKLVFFLASNCSKEITYSSLRKFLLVKSPTTVSDYCSYIENSYLCYFVPIYSDSVKAQQKNAKKVYFADHVLAKVLGFRNSSDVGFTLENIVFIELKRRGYDVYYYKDKHGCDFVARKEQHTEAVFQVSKELYDPDTKKREFAGLVEAMQRFDLTSGTIITLNEDYTEILINNNHELNVAIVSIWRWLLISPNK